MDNKSSITFKDPISGLSFLYPSNWKADVEPKNTYLFYDEMLGSFRFTPLQIKKENINLDDYLSNRFREKEDKNPEWALFNNKRFFCYKEGPIDDTNTVYFFGRHKNYLIIFSYSYHASMEDDDLIKNELKKIKSILENITY